MENVSDSGDNLSLNSVCLLKIRVMFFYFIPELREEEEAQLKVCRYKQELNNPDDVSQRDYSAQNTTQDY